MSASLPLYDRAVDAVPALAPREWRDGLVAALHAGARVITHHGRRAGDEVVITSVLETPDRALHASRTRVAAEVGYHELTSTHAGLHCFERELHEQTGARVAAHPWPKPIRHEGRAQADMDGFPYYRIDGKEVHEVAVGPVHAGVIEPGSFRFQCLGEDVHHLEIQLGYQHRGVERLLREREPARLGPLVETIAGDASIAHAWAWAAALERLAGVELDPGVEVARAVALELERVAMHLATLSGLAADIGFLQGATSYGRLRTLAINTTMRLCGSRFGRGAIRAGGVAMALPPATRAEVLGHVERLRRDLAVVHECFLGAQTVKHRLVQVGALAAVQARELGLVGPVARAAGVDVDARQGLPGGPWAARPIAPALASEGDCWARARVRILELDASLAWLAAALTDGPAWDAPRVAVTALAPSRLVVSVVEGWRGEVVHTLETGPAGELVHYKVQDPSLRNWMGLALAVRGNEISDFPICNKSFDLSYCGSDL